MNAEQKPNGEEKTGLVEMVARALVNAELNVNPPIVIDVEGAEMAIKYQMLGWIPIALNNFRGKTIFKLWKRDGYNSEVNFPGEDQFNLYWKWKSETYRPCQQESQELEQIKGELKRAKDELQQATPAQPRRRSFFERLLGYGL